MSEADLPVWKAIKALLHRSKLPLETLLLFSRGSVYAFRTRAEENPTSDGILMELLEGLSKLKFLGVGGNIPRHLIPVSTQFKQVVTLLAMNNVLK